jgi:hypothetical protein
MTNAPWYIRLATDNDDLEILFYVYHIRVAGPLMVAQWLRYCATNRKVAGLIPDSVIGIFH